MLIAEQLQLLLLLPTLGTHYTQSCAYSILKNSTSYGQISSKPKPRPRIVEAKAKATKFCPRGVLEVEASPRGLHLWPVICRTISSIVAVIC